MQRPGTASTAPSEGPPTAPPTAHGLQLWAAAAWRPPAASAASWLRSLALHSTFCASHTSLLIRHRTAASSSAHGSLGAGLPGYGEPPLSSFGRSSGPSGCTATAGPTAAHASRPRVEDSASAPRVFTRVPAGGGGAPAGPPV